ncbi:MAG: cadherin repeat domain-containing protein [Pirellulaceae bacterium]|nr:cadherin repeat domain-containing protein [Pirellulaceae bacterium]
MFGRPLRFEVLEARNLLAVFGTNWTYLPNHYPEAVDRLGCTGDRCLMVQGIKGVGNHQYRFFADGATQYEVTYQPSGKTVVVDVDNNKPVHLVTWNVGGGGSFEGTIYNPAGPALRVTSQWDENPDDSVLGPFLYGVELPNKIQLQFSPALPPDLEVQYRWHDQKVWRTGVEIDRDIATFPAGTTYLDVRLLDPQGRLLYKYDMISSVRTIDGLPTTMTWRDPHGNAFDARDVRFIEDVNAGSWTFSISAPYLPTASAYANYVFSLGFARPDSPSSVSFSTPLHRDGTGGKFSASGSVIVGSAFDDRVPGVAGVDYLARVIARPPRENAAFGKPFTAAHPIETTRLPDWMQSSPSDVKYGLTDVFGSNTYAYSIDVGRFEFDQQFPTVQDSPLELFDGRETYLKTELDVKVFASPNVRMTPEVTANNWRIKAELLDTTLTDWSGSLFPKSGVRATGQVEPHALGLDGAGISITSGSLVFASNKVVAKSDFQGLDLTVPFVSAGIGTLDAQLKVTASYEILAKRIWLEAGVQLVFQQGVLQLNRDGSFARLNLDAAGKIEVDGKGSLGISPGFTAPPGLPPEQRDKIEKFRFEIVQAVMKGTGTVNLNGKIQLNAQGPMSGPRIDFDDTLVTLSGRVSLKYNTCFAGDDVREFFGLKPCNDASLLETLGEKTFGPEVILGRKPPKADPLNPGSYSTDGSGVSGGTGPGEGEGGSLPPLSDAVPGGRLRFHQPFDRRLERIDYRFAAQAAVPELPPNAAFLEVVAVGAGESWILDRIDLATLDYISDSDLVATRSGTVPIAPDLLPDDRSYQIEFRLVATDEASAGAVHVRLTDFAAHVGGPAMRLGSPVGTVADGSLDFGLDTAGGTVGTLTLHNDGELPLVVESVEVVGPGFTLLDPSPWSRTVLEGQSQSYRIRLLDASSLAQAVLRIRSDDAEDPVRDVVLRYDGTTPLNQSGARVTAVVLGSSAAPGTNLSILSNSATVAGRTDFDQVRVTFDQPVRVPEQAFQLASTAQPELAITGFEYDQTTRSAVWTLSEPLEDGTAFLTLLDSIQDEVGNRLDGELLNAGPTGNGIAGGILRLRVDVQNGSQQSPALPASPVLAALPNQVLFEGDPLQLTARATPGQLGRTVAYALVEAPAHAEVDSATGVITWAPPERYPAGVYRFTVVASDAEIAGLTDYRSFEVQLVKTNTPPVIVPVRQQEVVQGDTLTLRVGARDADYPAQQLTYQLLSTAPPGASIDPQSGELSWAPGMDVAPGEYWLPIEVRDDAAPPASSTMAIPVTVRARNLPPIFESLPTPSGREGEPITFQVIATDSDSPPPELRLGAGSPEGATLDPATGVVAWTPGELDGRRHHAFFVEAVDGRSPELVTTARILVFVDEVNSPAVIVLPDEHQRTVELGSSLEFTISVEDPDVPATFKEFRLVGNSIEDVKLHPLTGEFSWLPPAEGTYEFTVQVIDYDHPRTVAVTEAFTVTVLPDTTPPQLELNSASPTNVPIVLVNASDNHELASLSIRFLNPPTDEMELDLDSRFTFLQPHELAALIGDDWQEGEYTIEVRAVDVSGNETLRQQQFTIDLTGPASAELAPEGSIETPDGGYRIAAPTVDLVGQTEPFGQVELSLRWWDGDEPTVYRAVGDSQGNLTVSNVHLESYGRNVFDVRTLDAAGNETLSALVLVRHTSDGTFGTDRFGYHATRVDAGFVDISATGQRLFEDGAATGVELTVAELPGFEFEFYGTTYDSIHLSLDGILSFGELVFDSPGFLPEAATIAPFWSSAQISADEDGVYWLWTPLTGGGRLTVQWQSETQGYLESPDDFEFGTIPVRFQAVLDTRDHSIEFHYDSLGAGPWLLAERDEMVFVKGSGESAIPDLGFLLAHGTMPFDLVDNQTSVRFAPTDEPFPPYLWADWTDVYAPALGFDVTVPGFPVQGRAVDRSGIAILNLELVGSNLPTVDALPWLQTDGHFSIELADLEDAWSSQIPEGQHVFRVRATDTAGNEASVELDLTIDTTAPELQSLELAPESRGRILGELVTDKPEITLLGRTEPGAAVTVEWEQILVAYEEADELGYFELRDLALDVGSNVFTFILTDRAGNELVETRDIVRVEGRSTAPDAYGYAARAIESGFLDIAATGQRILAGADEELATLGPGELGAFRFYFYGQEYSSLRVSPNGLILFGDLQEYAEADYYLEFSPRNAAIVPLGDDLTLTGSPQSGVYWQVVEGPAGSSLILQWHDALFQGGDGSPVTFQAVLHGQDGSIEFHYANLETGDEFAEGWASAIGIKAAGDQDDRNWVVDVSSYGWENDYVGSGRSLRIDREEIVLGAPRLIETQPAGVRAGWLDEFILTFDRAMDFAGFSFEEDVLEFTGPAGDLRSELTGWQWLDPRTLRIRFAPQHADGLYVLRLTPSIVARPDGTPIDQDGDGISGEEVDDQLTVTAHLANCVGPDAAGYRACAVAMEDIQLTPDMLGVFVIHAFGDDEVRRVDLKQHTLRVYDHELRDGQPLFVSTNGLISFGEPVYDAKPTDLASSPASLVIAPLWSDWIADWESDDLVLGWFQEDRGAGLPDRLIIQWQVYNFTYSEGFDPSTATFQAILELDTVGPGRMTFQYVQLELLGSSSGQPFPATVGLRSASDSLDARLLVAQPSVASHLVREGGALEIQTVRLGATMPLQDAWRSQPLLEVPLRFSDEVTGVDLTDFIWTRDGQPIDLHDAEISGNGTQFTVTLPAAPQVPGSYALTLLADGTITGTVGQTLLGTATVEWILFPENSPPTDIALSSTVVLSDRPGAVVGDVSVSDQDAGQTHSWSVSDPRFVVEANQLKLHPDAKLDYSFEREIRLTITVTDSGWPPASHSQDFVLTVVPGPSVPVGIALFGARVPERLYGASVGQLGLGDTPGAEFLQVSVDDPRFEVVGGQLKLTSDHFLDRDIESLVSVQVTVTRSDAPELTLTRPVLLVVDPNRLPWQNALNVHDANGDGWVTPLDVLVLINELNQRTIIDAQNRLPTTRPLGSTLPYFDVVGDGTCSPIDVLSVINFLNRDLFGAPEGEADSDADQTRRSVDQIFDEWDDSLDLLLGDN